MQRLTITLDDDIAQALDAWPDIWAAALDGRGRLVKGLD